jgi:hypothetical protein
MSGTPLNRADSDFRYCDIVMKGGITSGVVYPLAAWKLSERFVFKNIGGTSAGAIAAAAAAAAELTRERGGFDRLRALPGFLTGLSPEGTGSNLLAFFQPEPTTRRLFRICLAGLGGGAGGIAAVGGRVLLVYAWATLLGAAPALIFLALAWSRTEGPFFWLCLLLSVVLLVGGVLLAAAGALVLDVGRALPGNFYGLCSGMSADFAEIGEQPPAGRAKPLTYWLTEYLNEFLERSPNSVPLRFGELWGMADPKAPRQINLEMMTTCLTHGRPYRLPFRDDDDVRENRLFYFRKDEFERLFPKSVVDWMIENPNAVRNPGTKKHDEEVARRAALAAIGFYPLPAPADLPVVVAVRMSLSFPVLLSAIPLHAVDWSRDPNGLNPERCWFSDGGVCSNFPIHFFDSPIPRWPTFSINLKEKPRGARTDDLLQPEMVRSNSSFIQENWNRFESKEELDDTGTLRQQAKSGLGRLAGLAGAFITTMQNWSDNTQSRLPGFRDRIAHVGLTPEEGGLNLNMPAKRINDLTARGEAAGAAFIARFAPSPENTEMNWDNHRWLRMRSCLASLETMLSRIDRACAEPQPGDTDLETWTANTPPQSGAPGYDWASADQHRLALHLLAELRALAQLSREPNPSLADKSPRPRPELRPRAQL